jgi:ankyrin repeat protein
MLINRIARVGLLSGMPLIPPIQKSRLETAKLPLARDYINNMNLPDRNGWSPLFFAADTHDFPMVDLLLTKNDPNVRNIDGV